MLASISPNGPSAALPEMKAPKSRANKACESCRLLKVRCLFESAIPSQKCRRCAKSNHDCVVKAPGPRKKRKRTDTRIGELEKQVEFLRTILSQTSDGNHKEDRDGENNDGAGRQAISALNPPPRIHVPVQVHHDEEDLLYHRDHQPSQDAASTYSFHRPCPQSGGSYALPHSPRQLAYDSSSPETISSVEDASSGSPIADPLIRLFNQYHNELVQHYPLSLFADTEDANLVRITKPTLFLAVATSAAGASEPELRASLNEELAQEFARRIIVDGEKSIELIQALILAAVFYSPPDCYDKLKYYQYIHMAATMASELELARPDTINATKTAAQLLGSSSNLREVEENEHRRTLIASYMNCISVSRSMRRPSMLPADTGVEQCIEALAASPNSIFQDHQLIAWFRLECLMEATNLLGHVERGTKPEFADDSTQRTVKLLDSRLSEWRASLSPGLLIPTLEMTYHHSKMFLHEIAFHTADNVDDFRPPFRLASPGHTSHDPADFSPARLESIAISVSSAYSLLDVLLNISPQTLRVFPTVMFVRASYALFILMKACFICNSSGTPNGNFLPSNDVRLDEILDRIVAHLQIAANDGKCKLSSKFHAVFARSRDWFRKHSQCIGATSIDDDDAWFEPLRLLNLNDDQRRLCVAATPCQNFRFNPAPYPQEPEQLAGKDNIEQDTDLPPRTYSTGLLKWSSDIGSTDIWTQFPEKNLVTDHTFEVQQENDIEQSHFGSTVFDDGEFLQSYTDDMIADSFDFATGLDFDTQIWDLDMGLVGS